MPVAPRATARLTILLPRCRPKAPATRTQPIPRNPGPRKQSRPTARLPLQFAPSSLRLKRPPAQIKKGSFLRRRRRSRTGKTIPRQLGLMPTTLRLMRRKNGTTKATGGAITARRRAIFRGTARNFHKTSIRLGNFCVKD